MQRDTAKKSITRRRRRRRHGGAERHTRSPLGSDPNAMQGRRWELPVRLLPLGDNEPNATHVGSKRAFNSLVFFANGGSSYLELQRDMGADMIAVDWAVDMADARQRLGPNVPISGNIDPTVLFGSQAQIEAAVRDCIDKAGGPGNAHVLNLGHGVMQGTPEIAIKWLVDECKRYRTSE